MRGAGHPLQGCERGTHHGPPDQGNYQGAHRCDGQLDEQLGTDERLVRFQGEPGDDGVARGGVARGHHPVVAQVVQMDGDGVVPGGLGQQELAVLPGDGRVVAVLVDVGGRLATGARRRRGDERQGAGGLPGGIEAGRNPLRVGAGPAVVAVLVLLPALGLLGLSVLGLLRQVVALVGGSLGGRSQLAVRSRPEGVAQADSGEGTHDRRHDQDQPEHSGHQAGAQAAGTIQGRGGPPGTVAGPPTGRPIGGCADRC